MKTVEINVYSIDELSKNAQEKAYHEFLDFFDYPWAEENKETLREFENTFPVKVKTFEYGGNNSHINWEFTEDNDIREFSGIRLSTYIYNNFFDDIISPNFYSLWSKKDQNPNYGKGSAPWGKLKKRYSKVLFSREGCPFTGYCMDYDILNPIWDFLKNPDPSKDFEDLMQECLQAWLQSCNEDVEGMQSFEAFKETCYANDWHFKENGELCNLPY